MQEMRLTQPTVAQTAVAGVENGTSRVAKNMHRAVLCVMMSQLLHAQDQQHGSIDCVPPAVPYYCLYTITQRHTTRHVWYSTWHT